MIRSPAVAGHFYPADPKALDREVQECFELASHPDSSRPVVAVVCPHAGYVYSGAGAASALLAVPEGQTPDVVVMVGPNHTGRGSEVSVSAASAWETVGGPVAVDTALVEEITRRMPTCRPDNAAHESEHCLEVQIPFLQHRFKHPFSIVPIVLGVSPSQHGLELCLELGEVLGVLLESRSALLLASTDMSHYVSAREAKAKDTPPIRAICEMDPEELVTAVRRERVTMCGVMPVATVLAAASDLGATRADLVDYRTSGDASGDYDQVVSYAALAVTRDL